MIRDDVRGKIMSGQLSLGEHLGHQSVLMKQYGVSRSTVREALRMLEQDNLIETRQGAWRGPVVTKPGIAHLTDMVEFLLQSNNATLSELCEAGDELEIAALRHHAPHRNNAFAGQMDELVHELRKAIANGHTISTTKLIQTAHDLIFSMTDNKAIMVLGQAIQSLVCRQAALQARGSSPGRGNLERVTESLHILADLVRARNFEGAVAHWREHLRISRAAWMAVES